MASRTAGCPLLCEQLGAPDLQLVPQSSDVVSSNGYNRRLDNEDDIHNIVQDRGFMETHCLRGKGKDCRYAIKLLQDSSRKDAQIYINGVIDLAVEARFLSVVRHPNIIKMRAMAVTSPFSTKEPFFVVLDRLYDSKWSRRTILCHSMNDCSLDVFTVLGTRLSKWKKQKPGGVKKLLDRGGKKELAFWLERMTVAYDLASALGYLHDSKYVWVTGSVG